MIIIKKMDAWRVRIDRLVKYLECTKHSKTQQRKTNHPRGEVTEQSGPEEKAQGG